MSDIIKQEVTRTVRKGSKNSLERILGQEQNQNFSDTCIILDASASMGDRIGSLSKWDHLLHAVNVHFEDTDARGIVFSSTADYCDINNPPFLRGNTNMNLAFMLAQKMDTQLNQIIIISDGLPYPVSPEEVIKEAKLCRCKVDCIFIGSDDDRGAEFMKRLADECNGQEFTVNDNPEDIKLLKSVIAGLIPEKCIQL